MTEKILKAIKELRETSKKRNFNQTLDLIIGMKELDLKKPENKFSEDVVLPSGRGQEANVVVFSDTIKDLDCKILTGQDIQNLGKNKREVKKLAQSDFFLADAPLMPLIGKVLGQSLAPKGKMPRIISEDVKSSVKKLKSSIRIRLKDSPVIQCPVGVESMKDEEIAENVEAVLKFLETKLPKGRHNIKEVLIKLTMSKPIKIGE